jgi:PKD repeat protein
MKRLYLFLMVILLCSSLQIATAFSGDPNVIQISRSIEAAASEAGQKTELWIPAEPLDFDSLFSWDLTITKKSLVSEKDAAYFAIIEPGATEKTLVRRLFTGNGSLIVPKGTRYKVLLSAGEYSNFFSKSGAEVQAKLQYTEAVVRYTQGDQPYTFRFEASGPDGFTDWTWFWTGRQPSSGNPVTIQFDRAGKMPVILEAKGGANSRKFYFDLEVPSLVAMNPKVSPLQGTVELQVNAEVNAVVNYGQKANYTWDFGNGTILEGPQTSYTYTQPGKYFLTLTAAVDQYTYRKSWLVEAAPLNIRPNPIVAPLVGPVPLEVTGNVNPQITGNPTDLQYTWDIAGELVADATFQHTFTEPGDYKIVLQTVDKLHPKLPIPDETIWVKALPPQIGLSPKASINTGVIPLTVAFDAGLEVKGSPSDIAVHWDFGDGQYLDQAKPVHIFKEAGEYDVLLVVSDRLHPGNLSSAVIKIKAEAPQLKPVATASTDNGLIPFKVNFAAQTSITGSPSEPLYRWDFGDGATSFDQNPSHTYTREGTFAVKLVVQDRLHPENKAETSLQIVTKMPKLRLTASLQPTSGKAPFTVQCRAWGDKEGETSPVLKYLWDFGDGTQATTPDLQHVFEKPGTYTAIISIEDPVLGLKERKSFKVTVK